jgi:hypothetical protein
MPDTVTLRFEGVLPKASFAEFAAHRAARLSLDHRMLSQDAGSAVIRLTGPAVLIDAFEMALSLGPADCLVREVIRQDNAPPPETQE